MRESEILARALELMEEGWTTRLHDKTGWDYNKGEYKDRYCVLGAINKVVGMPLDLTGDCDLVAQKVVPTLYQEKSKKYFHSAMYEVNDREGYAAITDLVKVAIEAACAKEKENEKGK